MTEHDTHSARSSPRVRRTRLLLGVAIPTGVVAIAYGPLALLRGRLPEELASHYELGGQPDAAMSVAGFVSVSSVLVGLGLVLCAGLALRRGPVPQGVGSSVGFLGAFVAGLGALLLAVTVISQRDLVRWQDATLPWWLLLAMIVGALVLGVIGARAGAQLPHPTTNPADPSTAPVMDLGIGQRAVWTETVISQWPLIGGVVAITVGLVVAAGTMLWIALPSAITGTALIALSRLGVRADANGLRVGYGPFSWPGTTIPLDRIQQASVIDVRPAEWGGWGYRGSLTLMDTAAVVHRAGPGLRLDLADDKVFVVTVDDPYRAAALLNAEVRRRSAAAG